MTCFWFFISWHSISCYLLPILNSRGTNNNSKTKTCVVTCLKSFQNYNFYFFTRSIPLTQCFFSKCSFLVISNLEWKFKILVPSYILVRKTWRVDTYILLQRSTNHLPPTEKYIIYLVKTIEIHCWILIHCVVLSSEGRSYTCSTVWKNGFVEEHPL